MDLPSDTLNVSDQIATACESGADSFVITGRGGIPENPEQFVRSAGAWQGVRLAEVTSHSEIQTVAEVAAPVQTIVEAQRWVADEHGNISLVASASTEISSLR